MKYSPKRSGTNAIPNVNVILYSTNFLIFYTDTLKWSTPKVCGNIPLPRDGHSACIIDNYMYIFGGFQDNPSQFSQDLYMLNLTTMKWSLVRTKVLYQYVLPFNQYN